MKHFRLLACLAAVVTLGCPQLALAQHQYDALVETHAKANGVPVALVHRVIVRESRYRPDLIGRGGTIGLMQIKLATARGVGYTGDAEGLRDPDTNLAYGVKYLAGAWRTANGNHDQAVRYYASGYYEAAKRWRLEHRWTAPPVLASVTPKQVVKEAAKEAVKPEAVVTPVEATTPEPTVTPAATATAVIARPDVTTEPAATAAPQTIATPLATAKPKRHATRPKASHHGKKLAEAPVPRPPANIPGGAKATKPR